MPSLNTLYRYDYLSTATILLTALALILLPGYTELGKNIVYLLDILALSYLAWNFRQLGELPTPVRFFFIIIAVNFLWILFSYFVNGSPERGGHFIWHRQFFILFLIPLFYLYRHVSISNRVIWTAIVLSVLVSFLVSLGDVKSADGRYGDRAHGGMHPIEFGYMLFVMATYLSISAAARGPKYIRIVSLVAALIALLIVIWTQSRGVWAAIPVIPIVVISYIARRWTLPRKLGLLALTGVLIASSYLHPVVQKRIDLTIQNVDGYLASQDISDHDRRTSIGTRFEMWKAGWLIFLDNPITGVGLGGYQESARSNADRYNLNPSAYWFYHPHNQYISALSTRGFPGFVFLLMIIFLPIYAALKAISDHGRSSNQSALTVIGISFSFLIFGLADVPYDSKPTLLFYSIIMALMMSTWQKKKHTQ